MSKTTLKTTVMRLALTCEPFDFVQDGPFRLKRSVPHIDQCIEIQPGRDWLNGKFTCNLCWKHTADGITADDVYDHVVNVGWLAGKSESWMSHESKDALEVSFGHLKSQLLDAGIPFLDNVRNLREMLNKYEQAEKTITPIVAPTDPRAFFGIDEGWKHYNLGFAYKALGDNDKARDHFDVVLEQHSNQPFDWINDRRQRCSEARAST
jgi:tetratricopeptide (TPR) repeat protein